MKKVTLNLTPYTCLSIYSFLDEFIGEFENDPQLQSIQKCFAEYKSQMLKNMSPQQIEDAVAENEVNFLLGRTPKKRRNGEKPY